ncbi:MAG: hypothetical protein M1162_05945 [Candidatus Thermoplasmatota archaeon]|nr:hypothetical protein [Candidatus Thermoplasmatota archaeon]
MSSVKYADGFIIAERELEDGTEVIKMPTPVLLTILLNANVPRRQTLKRKIAATKQGYEVWNLEKLGMPPEWVGVRGSPTIVRKMRPIKEKERAAKRFEIDQIPDLVRELFEIGALKLEEMQ